MALQPLPLNFFNQKMGQEEEYLVPFEDQRVFGAGIKRKRVQFVSATEIDTIVPNPSRPPTTNAGDRYLSIVLRNQKKQQVELDQENANTAEVSLENASSQTVFCEICKLPISPISGSSLVASRPHEASLVHQFCLEHSHPPSHLDRQSHGLKYLSSYGWDPDSRLGLGAKGEGTRAPLKGKVKNDTVGLGVKVGGEKGQVVENPIVRRLDAKGVKRKDDEDRKRRERLQKMFYGNADVAKYLGEDG